MTDTYLQIKNDNGEVIYMQGLLPDGTYGIVADEFRPFTQGELEDAEKFKAHRDELAQRVDKEVFIS